MKPFTRNMFEDELAEFYDLMRTYRNYDLECRFADEVIKSFNPGAVNILDIFCGTGEHAVKMAQRGYTVTGIDASTDMLGLAEEKSGRAGVSVKYECVDFKNYRPAETYDAAYCLGYTFLYMLTHTDAIEFFRKVHDSLKSGGTFVLDFINGWAFLKEPDRDKFFYKSDQVKIYQFEQATLNKPERLIHLEYCYLVDRNDGQVKTIFAEEDLRIFFDDEVQSLLARCGFVNTRAYGDYSMNENPKNVPVISIIAGQKMIPG